MKNKDITSLIGKKFGRLLVLEFSGTNKFRRSEWKCQCDCGNTLMVDRVRLLSGNTQSCGCLNKDVISLPSGLATVNKIMYHYKAHAKRRNLPFELSKDRFMTLMAMNCFYCGTPPSRYWKNGDANGGVVYSGIDRIDSLRGYTDDNVVPCCKNCNYAKNTMSYPEFKNWIFRISDHMMSKEALYA